MAAGFGMLALTYLLDATINGYSSGPPASRMRPRAALDGSGRW
ncbi:hypothetical protein [Streptomyces mirabilis]